MFTRKSTNKTLSPVCEIPSQPLFSKVMQNPFSEFQLSKNKKKANKAEKLFSRLQQALKKHYNSNLYIKRLFYPDYLIPIDSHYICPSILLSANYQNQLGNNIPQMGKKEEIDIYEVSTQLYGHESELIAPDSLMPLNAKNTLCQILVLGTAGIGKSTLSEHLCHLWSIDDNHLSKEYDWVFRIPLRNLIAERYPIKDYSIIDIIERECLSLAINEQLTPDEKNLFSGVLFKAAEKREILVILDGFDELSEVIPSWLLGILHSFMSFEQLILTSRPYNLPELKQKYRFNPNRSYEITGFSKAGINKYVDDFFRYLPKDRSKESTKILSFLEQNRNIAGICRIPINLELFCSAWEKQQIPQGYYSITAIYEVVTRALCHRFLEREGPRKKTRDMDDALIWERCKIPLAFLDHFGYQSASTKKLFLNVTPTCQYLRSADNQHLHNNSFLSEQKSFGFIRPSNPRNEYDGASLYYFNHLTFRDYFAARYLTQCFQLSYKTTGKQPNFSHTWLSTDDISLEAFLRKKRFEPRYEFIWWFMAGILAAQQDISSFKKLLSLFLAEDDKAEISRFLLLMRCLDEASEAFIINEQLPQELWSYIEEWFDFIFHPLNNLILLHNQSEIINTLKISPSIFVRDTIQDFFCDKIPQSDIFLLQKFLDFFCRIGLPLPEPLEEELLARFFRLASTLNRTELKNRQIIIQYLSILYQKNCLSLSLLRQKYQETQTKGEVNALINAIFLCLDTSPEDTITLVKFREEMHQNLLNRNNPLLQRIAAASILGNFYELGIFLLLKQNEGYYHSYSMHNFFIWDSSKGIINFLGEFILQKLQKEPVLDFEFLVLLQRLGEKCYSASFFKSLLLKKSTSTKEKLIVFLCWINSLKTGGTSNYFSKIKQILEEFKTLLMKPDLESESESFSDFLVALFSPAMPIASTKFIQVREQFITLFLDCFDYISARTIKKYLALILSCYAPAPNAQCPMIFNTVIHSTYSNEEFIKLFPKSLMMDSSFQWGTELSFCSEDCTIFLNQLVLDDTTNNYSLFLLLNKTPIRAILKFAIGLLNQNEEGARHLLASLILRCLTIGKAFYLNEEGIWYFEHPQYKMFPLSRDERMRIEKLIHEVATDKNNLHLPIFPPEIRERLTASGSNAKTQNNKTKYNQKKESVLNIIIKTRIKNNSNSGKKAGSKTTNISHGAVVLDNSRADYTVTSQKENVVEDTSKSFKTNTLINSQGKPTMPKSITTVQRTVSNNTAMALFHGDGTGKIPSHLAFNTWYHPEICHYLLQMSPNQAQCLRVIFDDSGYDNNTATFKDQLQTLIVLANQLNRPALFISKEPGANNHFVCGLIRANNLLLINPLGITRHADVYNTLGELQQSNILNNIWLSSTVLQNRAYEESLVSCGAISLELAIHISKHFTLERLHQFWDNLKTNEVTTDDASSLRYFGIPINTLLSENLQQLAAATNQTPYQSQMIKIRHQHGEALERLTTCRAQEAKKTAETYIADCKESAPAQVVYNALLTREHDITTINQLPEYLLLTKVLSLPERLIIAETDAQENEVASSSLQSAVTQFNKHAHIIMPSYFEYSVMSDYSYLDAKEKDKKALLTLLTDWEVQDYPNGGFKNGYVGAVFIHPTRKQIVVAHAGTLPLRVKTLLADARGIVNKGTDPLVLDALMQSQGHQQTSLKDLIKNEGYHLSFTGHSLGGFLAELSVYACHRGFGLNYPEASAVVFDSPGSIEVMQEWESHIKQHQVDINQLNVISFLSSPNLVNTLNSHPRTVYRLIRPMPLSTFQLYLLESHDRKKMFKLFNQTTGYPENGCWAEMEDWPLADYDELLALREHLVSGTLDLVVSKTMDLIDGFSQALIGRLMGSAKKASPTRLFGGTEPKHLWELLNSGEEKNYHQLFDTTTSEGLGNAINTHYKVYPSEALKYQLPLINISPWALGFLAFHERHQASKLYQDFVNNTGLEITLPGYRVDEVKKRLGLETASDITIKQLLDKVASFRAKSRQVVVWGDSYISYVENVIKRNEKECLYLAELVEDIKQQTHGNKDELKETQAKLEESQKKQLAFSKELEALKEEIKLVKSQGDTSSIFAAFSAVALEQNSDAKNKVTLSSSDMATGLEKSQQILKQEREQDRIDKRFVNRRITSVFSAVATEKEAKAGLELTINPDKNREPDTKSGQSSPSQGFFNKEEIIVVQVGSLFRVKINYGKLNLSSAERDLLQLILKGNDGEGAFAYEAGSSLIKNKCIIQLDFYEENAAIKLIKVLYNEISTYKQPATSVAAEPACPKVSGGEQPMSGRSSQTINVVHGAYASAPGASASYHKHKHVGHYDEAMTSLKKSIALREEKYGINCQEAQKSRDKLAELEHLSYMVSQRKSPTVPVSIKSSQSLSEQDSNPFVNTSPSLFSSTDLAMTRRKGLKKESKLTQVLQQYLPTSLILGKAHAQGDCFFDALAQCLNRMNSTDVNTDKYLRMLCHDYYGKNKAWVDKLNLKDYGGVDKHDDYSMVQYTVEECEQNFHGRSPIWGRPYVEGIMLCNQLKLRGLCIIEILEHPETKQPIPSFHWVNKESYTTIDEREAKERLSNPEILTLVVEQNSLHFVPLMVTRAASLNSQVTPSAKSLLEIKKDEKKHGLKNNNELPKSDTSITTQVYQEDRNRISKLKEQFLQAINDKNLDEVKKILAQDSSVILARNEQNYTALHLSIIHFDENIFYFLAKKAPELLENTLDNQCKASLLYLACSHSGDNIIGYLIEHENKINDLTKEGSNSLLTSAKEGKLNIVKLLISRGAEINVRCLKGLTPFLYAAINEHIPVMEYLLKSNSISIDETQREGQTALHLATLNDKKDAIIWLLNNKANLNIKDQLGKTAFLIAAEKNLNFIAKLLLEGSDINTQEKTRGWSALHFACDNKNVALVKLIMSKKIDIDAVSTDDHSTPLHLAVINNCLEVVKVLIDNNADTHIRTFNEETALCCAAKNGYKEIVALLLKKGADVNSSLERARVNHHEGAVKLLLEAQKPISDLRSELNTRLVISQEYWILHMARKIDKGDIDHVFLVLEGIENNTRYLYYFDLINHLKKEKNLTNQLVGKALIRKEKFEGNYNDNLRFQVTEINNICGIELALESWSISQDFAKKLIEDIDKDMQSMKTTPISFYLLGNKSFRLSSSQDGHNCFTWARKKINSLNHPDIKVPDDYRDWLLASSQTYLPAPRQNNHSFWSQKNICPALGVTAAVGVAVVGLAYNLLK